MQTTNHHGASGSGSSVSSDSGLSYSEAFPQLPDTVRQSLPTASPWASRPAAVPTWHAPTSAVVEKLHIGLEERARRNDETRFGKDGESEKKVCIDIQRETGTTINMTQNKDGSIVLLISGKREAVHAARNTAIRRLQSQGSLEMAIPKEYHRFILGAKAATKAEIEERTATKITVPSMNDGSAVIKIVGSKEGMQEARAAIQAIYDKQSKLASERLNIPKMYHPFIVGPKNANVDRLKAQTGVQIHVPPPMVQQDEIGVAGEKEAVAFVKNELLRLYQDIAQKCKEVTVEVPKEQHRYVQGPRSDNLHMILEKTGVWVEIPPVDSDSNSLTLRGNPAKFGDALSIVFEKANSVVKSEVSAPSWVHKHMIGRGGDKVRELQDTYNVQVKYADDDKIRLEGSPSNVEIVRRQLETEAKTLVSTLAVQEMKMDEKFMKHIIGKGGANVIRLKTELGVQIRLGDAKQPNLVTVEGPKEGVAEAIKFLNERVGKMENERSRDIIIDRRLHKLIIGQNGAKIREIRENFKDTNVVFPTADENSDIVTIRGPKEEVDKCFKYMEKLVKELVISNHVIEVPIFKDMHRAIIGKGGVTIKKIRDETDTKIDLPAENSDSDVILITGKKENAEKARLLIQDIQNKLANAVDVKMTVPSKLHTYLIGKNGRTIQAVVQECGNVSIQIPPPASKSDEITIRGPKADAEKARALLEKIAHDQELSNYTVDIPAKQEYHKYIAGQNRVNVNRLRDRFNVRIVIPSASAEERDIVSIIGKKEDVEKAKVEIEKTIKELQNTIDDTIAVPLKHHQRFVARRGETLDRIQEEAGRVEITFPRAEEENENVKLRGPKDAVENVKRLLLKKIDDWESEITKEVDIPAKFYGYILGPKGININNIQHDHNVHIKFPERRGDGGRPAPINGRQENEADQNGGDAENGSEHSETDVKKEVISVTGRPEDVEAAEAELRGLVPVEEEIEIAYEHHRNIIGRSGENIRQLMNQYKVNISVPHPDKNSNVIKLNGRPKDVEEAKKALTKMVETFELENFRVELRVDPKYHFKLIGQGGVEVNKLRNQYKIQVQFPREVDRAGDKADLIVLIGLEEKVLAARDKILAVVEDLSTKMELDVTVDNRIHHRIIGKAGSSLKKLMERFKVDIRMPRRDDPSPDLVVITGDEANVYDAEAELKRLEDLYLDDVVESSALRTYHAPSRGGSEQSNGNRGHGPGFVVQGAPWQRQAGGDAETAPAAGDLTAFPSLAGMGGDMAPTTGVTTGSRWGPQR